MSGKTIKQLIHAIIKLAIFTCIISINDNSIYQDGEWANAQLLGQDVVTLFIAVPMLYLSYIQAINKDRWKWKMILGGILFYFVYTYAFFMFATKLTFLYLFHLPIFGLSVIGLFGVLFDLFHQDFEIRAHGRLVKGWVVGFLLLISLLLGFLWLSDIASHLAIEGYRSDTPDGEPLLIVYSLDLALVIPLMILAAIGYWQDKQYGYLLTGVMLTKVATIGFALMGMGLALYFKKLSLDTMLIGLWCFLGIVGTITTIMYLRHIEKS